ncbi:MAG: hypothetical protein V4581_12550 [Bacteroidota bacterium]
MRRIVSLFVLGFILCSFTASTTDFSLLGTWKAVKSTENLTIIFEADGFSTWKNGEEVMGGKKFEMDGKFYQMTYKSDMSVKPHQLDFIMTELETKKERTMWCIFEVVSDDEIKINMSENERPVDYVSGGVMKRVK